MKKLSVVLVVVLVAMFVFTACAPAATLNVPQGAETKPEVSDKTEQSKTPTEDAKVVIGYNQGSDSVDFFKKVGESIKREADKMGAEVVWAESNFDAEQIIPKVETLMMQGANVIIDFNVNAEMGGNIVEIAKAKGIPTIGVDVLYTSAGGDKSYFMGANNAVAGKVAGKALGEAAKTKFGGELEKLVLVYNSENGDAVKQRVSESVTGLKEMGIDVAEDKIEWIDLGGGGADSTIPAKDKMTGFLTANPDLTKIGVVTVNDQTAQGVLAAVDTSNKGDKVIIVSHGSDEPSTQNLRSEPNSWIGSVGYFPEKYGEYLVPLAMKLAKGEDAPPKTLLEHEFIDITNVDKYYPES